MSHIKMWRPWVSIFDSRKNVEFVTNHLVIILLLYTTYKRFLFQSCFLRITRVSEENSLSPTSSDAGLLIIHVKLGFSKIVDYQKKHVTGVIMHCPTVYYVIMQKALPLTIVSNVFGVWLRMPPSLRTKNLFFRFWKRVCVL